MVIVHSYVKKIPEAIRLSQTFAWPSEDEEWGTPVTLSRGFPKNHHHSSWDGSKPCTPVVHIKISGKFMDVHPLTSIVSIAIDP